MEIVQLALRGPYTFIVAALSGLIVSPLVILRTPTDIFPNITIPIVSIVWCGNTPKPSAGASNGQAEDSLWTLFRDFKTGSSASAKAFRRFAQSGAVSPYVKLRKRTLRMTG
jgi:hypothetical protein